MILNHACWVHGTDAEFCVEFEYEPYVPAKISGPPENCYPEEGGEVTLLNVFLTADPDQTDVLEVLSEKTQERLKDKCTVWAREAQATGEL